MLQNCPVMTRILRWKKAGNGPRSEGSWSDMMDLSPNGATGTGTSSWERVKRDLLNALTIRNCPALVGWRCEEGSAR